MVAITDANGNQFCGGTLVASKYVVTAAHCMFKDTQGTQAWTAAEIRIRIGDSGCLRQRDQTCNGVPSARWRIHVSIIQIFNFCFKVYIFHFFNFQFQFLELRLLNLRPFWALGPFRDQRSATVIVAKMPGANAPMQLP